jgi:D-glycero-D-manno-heptose 1,7-bisphosphate phosphatase
MPTHLIVLGRDGVINNRVPNGVRSVTSWQPVPGSLRAIARLNSARYQVVVATNQPGLAIGAIDRDTLDKIHARMRETLAGEGGAIDAVAYCPHRADDKCNCRKPQPGMLLDVARRLGIGLDGVPVVGDSLDDVGAALSVGARPILVRTGLGRDTEPQVRENGVVEIYDDLADAVDAILEGR